jgi:hypothetical protein
VTEQDDPRIPRPRKLPRSLQPKDAPKSEEMPAPPPVPKIAADLVKYLEHHFPEKSYPPEEVSSERLWFDQGTRILALHLIGISKRQAKE